MPTLYLDSSAVVKLYVREAGTRWLTVLADPASGNILYIGRIAGVEVVSAIARRIRGNTIPSADGGRALRDFQHDFSAKFNVLETQPGILQRAMALAETYALRGFDAVQLA